MKRKQIPVNLHVELLEAIENMAKIQKRTRSNMIEALLIDALTEKRQEYRETRQLRRNIMNANKVLNSFTDLPKHENMTVFADGEIWLDGDVDRNVGLRHRIVVKPVNEVNRDQLEREGWAFNRKGDYAWGYNGYEA